MIRQLLFLQKRQAQEQGAFNVSSSVNCIKDHALSDHSRICLIHAYPSAFLIDSLGDAGFSIVIVGNSDYLSEHSSVEAVLDVPMWDTAALLDTVINYHRHSSFDAILPVNEGTVFITAQLNEILGLNGISINAALASRNKFLTYMILDQCGVATPESYAVYDSQMAWSLARKHFNGRAVVKLVDSMNSQGVVSFQTEQECCAAVKTLLTMTEQGLNTDASLDRNRFAYGQSTLKLILQEFCDGTEVSVEVFLEKNGDDRVLAILQKAPSNGPYFAETASYAPTTLSSDDEQQVGELALKAARALGLKEGPAHVEVRFDGVQPKVLEAGLRPGGGYTVQLVQDLLGENIYVSQAKLATNAPFERVKSQFNGAILFGGVIYHRSGYLESVLGLDVFDNMPQLEKVIYLNKESDYVKAMPESSQPHFCYFLLRGKTTQELLQCHRKITESVKLIIK